MIGTAIVLTAFAQAKQIAKDVALRASAGRAGSKGAKRCLQKQHA
jgi:ABC-type nickel/cobalt efflux system permease component RcnA